MLHGSPDRHDSTQTSQAIKSDGSLASPEGDERPLQRFGSGDKQYYVPGTANDLLIEASQDTGAAGSFISPAFARTLGLRARPNTERKVTLPDGR